MRLPEYCFQTEYTLTANEALDPGTGQPMPGETVSGRCMVHERAAGKIKPEEAEAGIVVRAILRNAPKGDLHRFTNGACVLSRGGDVRTLRVAQAKRTRLPRGKEYVMLELMGCE